MSRSVRHARLGEYHGSASQAIVAPGASSAVVDERKSPWTVIGIGGHLAMSPLPHHRAYGSVPRRFGQLSGHDLSR